MVKAAAIIQVRNKPSNFQKLTEKSDLLDFVSECDDFCITKHYDSDKQRGLSEDFGIALSVLITDHYYDIDWTTLGKIPRRRASKPDIKCFSKSNEALVIEAKGTTNQRGRLIQKTWALNQKRTVQAHVNLGSCALLNENSISDIDYFDPPLIPPEDIRYEKSILKADHYSRLFNLMGQKELSKYFGLMRKRIIHNTDFKEYELKEELYTKIKEKYVKIAVSGQSYFGNIERLDDKSIIFMGIDEGLLSVRGFIDFKEYEERNVETESGEYYLFSDGLCIGLLKDIKTIETLMKHGEIPHHYASFALSDFDFSSGVTTENYLGYLFNKVGARVQRVESKDVRADLIVEFENKKYAIEVKRFLNTRRAKQAMEILQQLTNSSLTVILITNSNLTQRIKEMFYSKQIKVIDRKELSRIIRDNNNLLKYLK
jgi:hypothetical protein